MPTAVSLAPAPVFKAFDNNGIPLLGGKLYTYIAGTSTPQATYTDATGSTPNTNPVILNARGEANVWLATGLTYKLTLQDSLGNQIWSVDQVPGGTALTAAVIGSILYPQTAAEAAASVTPTNFQYAPWRGDDIRRFGAVGDGVTNNAAALVTANSVGAALYIAPGTYVVGSNITLTVPLFFDSSAILKPANGVTITINAPVNAGLWKIFDQSAGGTISGKVRASAVVPEWFGATGNGKKGSTGIVAAIGTAFTDANAVFTSADVGKTIFIIPPPYTSASAFPAVQSTISAFVSTTAVTLAAAPSWASNAAFTAGTGGVPSQTLTVASVTSGTLAPGQTILSGGTGTIAYQLTGPAGGVGTYHLSTSQTIATSTAMSASIPLSYYYGTDDTAAILAANALVGSQGLSLGYSGNYDTYQINGTLQFTGPAIYLMTQQAVVGGAVNTSAHRWEGAQGRPTIAFGIASATTDCLLFGSGAVCDGNTVKDLYIDCCFSGRDGIVVGGFQSPQMRNVEVANAARDGLSVFPAAGSFIQQGIFDLVQTRGTGRHGIYVNTGSGAFANECNWNTCVTGSCSQRVAGGTGLYFDSIPSNQVDTWTFNVTKFTNGWNGDPNFQPLPNAVFVNTSAAIFGGSGMKLINCYCEQSGAVLGATSPAIKVSAGSNACIKTEGFAAYAWGVDLTRAPFDGASQFTVANGSSQDVLQILTGQQWSGEIEFYLNDGTNATRDRRQFDLAFAVNGTITALGAVNTGTAVTYTITATATAGTIHVTVNNTGSVPFLMQYIALTKHRIGAAPFVY